MKNITKTLTALTIASTLASGGSIFANAATPETVDNHKDAWESLSTNIGTSRLSYGEVIVSTNSITGVLTPKQELFLGMPLKLQPK